MVVWSMSLANPYDSALVMFGFGLGTLPAMLIAGRVFSQFKSWACSPLVRRIAGASVILFGIYSAYGSFAHQHSDHHTAQSSPPQAALSLTEPVPAILRKVA